jgi:hypothetical protein
MASIRGIDERMAVEDPWKGWGRLNPERKRAIVDTLVVTVHSPGRG